MCICVCVCMYRGDVILRGTDQFTFCVTGSEEESVCDVTSPPGVWVYSTRSRPPCFISAALVLCVIQKVYLVRTSFFFFVSSSAISRPGSALKHCSLYLPLGFDSHLLSRDWTFRCSYCPVSGFCSTAVQGASPGASHPHIIQ